ncbi:BamA/TamA family outer membrane protein [Tellurirhabdus bombi]|uniref:BamA/TamA family outer membrane protein n=1 Tax=Tellurirhabdus bombi TaxID=2907205 RepID=UPI001F2BE54F|nr:BamA/TamA family outer membrane protein [Tellurirhabdus bombi]
MFLSILFCLSSFGSTGVQASADSLVVVRSVVVSGNHKTRERIILREMEVKSGDTVLTRQLTEKLAWDQRKISNTNLFVTVDVTAKSIDEQQIDVEVSVKERWYFFAIPTFFLADRNFNEWWYERGRDLRRTIYGARLYYKNVTGNNDRLRAIAEFGFLRRFDLAYSLPYVDKAQKTGLSVGVAYLTNKEIAYRSALDKLVYLKGEELLRERFTASASLTRRNRFYSFHRLDLRYSNTTIADTVARLNPDYLLDSKTRQRFLQLSYTYNYDRRDNVAYPLKGKWLTLSASRLGLLPTDDLQQTELTGSLTGYLPLGGRFYASHFISGKISWPERQPYANLRGLGYTNDFIRGYELYVIDGQQYGILKNTWRYQLLNIRKHLKWIPVRQFSTIPLAVYLTAFGDVGYVRNSMAVEYKSRLANQWQYGTGIGLDVVTFYNAVFQFNYALNRLGQTGFYFSYFYEL